MANCRPASRDKVRISAMSGTTDPSLAYSPGCGIERLCRVAVKPARRRTRKRYDSLTSNPSWKYGAGFGQGLRLASEFASPVLDCDAFRGGFGAGPLDGEEGVDIWVASESRTMARTVPTWSWNRSASWSAGSAPLWKKCATDLVEESALDGPDGLDPAILGDDQADRLPYLGHIADTD